MVLLALTALALASCSVRPIDGYTVSVPQAFVMLDASRSAILASTCGVEGVSLVTVRDVTSDIHEPGRALLSAQGSTTYPTRGRHFVEVAASSPPAQWQVTAMNATAWLSTTVFRIHVEGPGRESQTQFVRRIPGADLVRQDEFNVSRSEVDGFFDDYCRARR